MVRTNSSNKSTPTKITIILSILFFISGCQTGKSPEQVAYLFWQSLAQGQLENAKQYVTKDSQHLISLQDIEKNSSVKIGETVINDENDLPDAQVTTTISRHKKLVTFDTVLKKENDTWRIDYVQTQLNISMIPLNDIAKSLQNLGDAFTKQLEQQLPLIQKEMESFGDELKNKLDEFSRSIEKPNKSIKFPNTPVNEPI